MYVLQGEWFRRSLVRLVTSLRILIGTIWLVGQVYIIFNPAIPMIQRPLHLMLAMGLVILWKPLTLQRIRNSISRVIDAILFSGVIGSTIYHIYSATRLTSRMETIDEIFRYDIVFGVITLIVILECVRRVVGWSLLGVLLLFLVYGILGPLFPGWLKFQGFNHKDMIEILTMTANGIYGIPNECSLQFVFYFVAFGSIYSIIGGSQLFIDIGLSFSGRTKGGAAKSAVISSSLMGSISGSAVANVSATGVFTIPLMRKAGLNPERAAATEAVASTGGQLMPPIMGVAAFVMAELLQMNYTRIALAGLIPALAYYVAIFLAVDLHARKTGKGNLSLAEIGRIPSIMRRLYLLIPPVVLILVLVSGYSATYAAVMGCAACIVTSFLKRESRLNFGKLIKMIEDATKQAAQVAVPISAIGIVVAIAIQSNLALKFSTRLIEISGGSLLGSMFFVIMGCIIMGMGLPTVAAYIIGAILFVPTLLKLGIPELSAHLFTFYYCVLAMVTPPVALASYTAAGLADANTMQTSFIAFRISLVSFFIPFAFSFDTALLGFGSPTMIVIACCSLLLGTSAWAFALIGYLKGPLGLFHRIVFGIGSLAIIFYPTGTPVWVGGVVVVLGIAVILFFLRKRAPEKAASSVPV
jgi:TRAP transporter 4TM/12TM fusion protein